MSTTESKESPRVTVDPKSSNSFYFGTRFTNLKIDKVIKVIDGDSIKLEEYGALRLVGIDAPELKQPFGTDSKDYLDVLMQETNYEVYVGFKEKDRYQRWLGDVFTTNPSNEIWVNQQMVVTGHAWQYLPLDRTIELMGSQVKAQLDRVGLWGLDGEPQAPWDYRREMRAVWAERRRQREKKEKMMNESMGLLKL